MSKSKYNKRLKERIKKEKDEMKSRLKAKRICMWIMLVFEAFLIFLLCFDVGSELKTECTQTANAVVKDKEVVTGGNHYIKTLLTIEVEEGSDFSLDVVKSTGSDHDEGDRIKIHYEPGDHSNYYLDGDLEYYTAARIVLIVLAVLMGIVSVLVIRAVINEKKKQETWRKENNGSYYSS
ncbi:MAG: hypothetical protein J5956_04750 [Ruminococcus sp.]|nr:hypothetical protein [Ruminococcus sp.]